MPLRTPSSKAAPRVGSAAPGAPVRGVATRGDEHARQELDRVYSAAYEELRRLASCVRRNDPGATITPTGLVNEAWLKLAGTPAVARTSPLHFRRIAARAMRQVLVEAARRRHARKRGGRDAVFVTFDEALPAAGDWATDVVGLDEALAELADLAPRQALLVEGRFFGGLEMAEVADALGISEATATRDWRAARAWLGARLRESR